MLNNIVDNFEQCWQQNIVQACFHHARTVCSLLAVYTSYKACGFILRPTSVIAVLKRQYRWAYVSNLLCKNKIHTSHYSKIILKFHLYHFLMVLTRLSLRQTALTQVLINASLHGQFVFEVERRKYICLKS